MCQSVCNHDLMSDSNKYCFLITGYEERNTADLSMAALCELY